MVEYSDNVGIAFAVVIAAGLSTAVGASVVFFPSLIQYANRKTLAGGLGLSAGVMTYVSFAEIYQKSIIAFVDADFLQQQAVLAASLCFFMGIIFMICLNLVIHGIASDNLLKGGNVDDDDDDDDSDHESCSSSSNDDYQDEEESRCKKSNNMDDKSRKGMDDSALIDTPSPCMCSDNPVERLEHMQEMAKRTHDREEHEKQEEVSEENSKTDVLEFSDETVDNMEQGNCKKKNKKKTTKKQKSTASTTSSSSSKKKKKLKPPSKKDKHKLTMMSLNTAVAIALHNFPEGLATFVATLQDPAVGAVLAVAIAIHNIPEGLCVAMPVYYATGNRWRAFLWGLLSGISEPIAALFGWLVLSSMMNDLVYGVLFGVVAGMMVLISVKELLPTAHRYDPDDSVVTNMFIIGMAVMGASLVLFAQIS